MTSPPANARSRHLASGLWKRNLYNHTLVLVWILDSGSVSFVLVTMSFSSPSHHRTDNAVHYFK